jgi:hypothetical protein
VEPGDEDFDVTTSMSHTKDALARPRSCLWMVGVSKASAVGVWRSRSSVCIANQQPSTAVGMLPHIVQELLHSAHEDARLNEVR